MSSGLFSLPPAMVTARVSTTIRTTSPRSAASLAAVAITRSTSPFWARSRSSASGATTTAALASSGRSCFRAQKRFSR